MSAGSVFILARTWLSWQVRPPGRQTRLPPRPMPNGPRHAAYAAFVEVLRRLSGKDGLRAGQSLTPRTPQSEATKVYKKLLLKTHPDKGGAAEAFRDLKDAEAAFREQGAATGGRPPAGAPGAEQWGVVPGVVPADADTGAVVPCRQKGSVRMKGRRGGVRPEPSCVFGKRCGRRSGPAPPKVSTTNPRLSVGYTSTTAYPALAPAGCGLPPTRPVSCRPRQKSKSAS